MTPFSLKMTIDAPLHLPLSRREVVDQIEQLMTLLDKMDVDPDYEADLSDYEPSLGWTEMEARFPTTDVGRDDREEDAGDDSEIDEDREWSLGSLGNLDQRGWHMGAGGDLEAGR